MRRTPASTYIITVVDNGDIWATGYLDIQTSLSAVYLSTDNGDTWVQKFSFSSPILSIDVNPINGYVIINGMGRAGGLFRSTDRGETWLRVIDTYGKALLVTPSGEIYFGTSGSIFYSNDNGDTWIEKSNGLSSDKTVASLALGADGTLYEGTSSGGVYRSTDGGDTWLPPSNYNTVPLIRGLVISYDGSIFATTQENGVLKSTDKGVTWSKINTGYAVDEDANAIIYNPITREVFVGDSFLYSGVYRSTDLGTTWELINSGIPKNTYIGAFEFNPNTGQMYVLTNDGVYRSRNYPK